jgi:hypothetical protein
MAVRENTLATGCARSITRGCETTERPSRQKRSLKGIVSGDRLRPAKVAGNGKAGDPTKGTVDLAPMGVSRYSLTVTPTKIESGRFLKD